MPNSTPAQLRFSPSAGFSIRADFAGGGLSSDLGPLLLRGVDRQIGLTARLAAALVDRRHPSYVIHSSREVLTQRLFQIASGYEDGNDCQTLRHDPMFRLGAGRKPFDADAALASGATISRFEHCAKIGLNHPPQKHRANPSTRFEAGLLFFSLCLCVSVVQGFYFALISTARTCAANLSSTPLTNLCPSLPPKVLASSTASLITTRYGTSGCCASS